VSYRSQSGLEWRTTTLSVANPSSDMHTCIRGQSRPFPRSAIIALFGSVADPGSQFILFSCTGVFRLFDSTENLSVWVFYFCANAAPNKARSKCATSGMSSSDEMIIYIIWTREESQMPTNETLLRITVLVINVSGLQTGYICLGLFHGLLLCCLLFVLSK
jgi:hypothetical protein